MATALKKQATGTAERRKPAVTQHNEPKRLSKFALWRIENPHGIITVNDWRAVNK